MPRVHRADWILPIDAPPIRDGWVEVEGGRIVGLGGRDNQPAGGRSASQAELLSTSLEARTVILPALVNAHTHLELSWMRGRVPPGGAMPAWATRLIGERLREDHSASGIDKRREAVVAAIAEARATGTTLVGDVSNALEAFGTLVASRLSAVVFYELLGFRSADPVAMVETAEQRLAALPRTDRVWSVTVPHAPYSVSPDLFRAIGQAAASRPLSVHLGESPEEMQFLRDGSGPWRDLLERIGAWAPEWVPPACGPVEYLDRLGLLDEHLVAVHGVQFEDDDLRRLAARGATVVTCPRSNRWTGAGEPPVRRFYASGVRVAIGTDSLASVEDLNLFNEMAEIRRLAPEIAAADILRSATLDGASALGFEQALGSISIGKRAELIAVRMPAGVEDVEEWLVGGLQSSDIEWLDAD